jgi:hypothetical protein
MPKKQKGYALLHASTAEELEDEVNVYLDDGWELKDPTWTDGIITTTYYQVMVR